MVKDLGEKGLQYNHAQYLGGEHSTLFWYLGVQLKKWGLSGHRYI